MPFSRQFWIILGCIFLGWSRVQAQPTPVLLEINKIWDKAPHNAFTDLIRFQDQWICAFREGEKHVSPDGAMRIIGSKDGRVWESLARLTVPGADLRDAKLSITQQGQLMLAGAAALGETSKHSHQSLAWFSSDGITWSDPVKIGEPDNWLWRITWKGNSAFGIGYGVGKDRYVRLYQSRDGKQFETLVPRLFDQGYPNESATVFAGDIAYCLLRRDGNPSGGLIGTAKPPYTHWTWKDLGTRIGGPAMVRLADGRLLAVVRLHSPKTHVSLAWIDPEAGTLKECLELPSGGDCSYAGLALQDGLLWVSYYSSHEGKSNIYLAKVLIPPKVVPIGDRRELFLDKYLIQTMNGTTLRLQEPKLAAPTPEPANAMEYGTVLLDNGLFRLYTRDAGNSKFDGDTTEVTRYCESNDGIRWTKPILGLVEVDGSRENNVILKEAPFCHNFSPFIDQRPGVEPEQKYKALAGTVKSGLFAFVSRDGLRWKKLRDQPVITYSREYAFDSQNVSFWSVSEGQYVCYFRHFLDKKWRSVCRTTSKDFITWSDPVPLNPNFPGEHIYTTLTHPYFRAPHHYVALPTRFHPDRGESTDILFMSARAELGGAPFDRTFREAFIRPGLDPARWGNRSNYAALNVLPTGPQEMSIFVTPFRRFTLRTDGFASVHAGADPGEMVTHPLSFKGGQLEVNLSTSAGGKLQVEIQDESGRPIPGFALKDCKPIVGDGLEMPVEWTGGVKLQTLQGRPVRLRFVLQDADLFAMRFRE